METITPEAVKAANAYIDQFLEDGKPVTEADSPDQEVPWEQKRPLSWADFLAILVRYSEQRGWEVIYDSVDDLAVAIFAHDDQREDEVEALQGRLPLEDDPDACPF
jgi:hypothetical protein